MSARSDSTPAALVCPCPPQGVLGVVGKKWAICVVSLVGRYGSLPFGAIQRTLYLVSPATLSTTLRTLEREGLIRRQPHGKDLRSPHQYVLTPRGSALYRGLLPLASWVREVDRRTGRESPIPRDARRAA